MENDFIDVKVFYRGGGRIFLTELLRAKSWEFRYLGNDNKTALLVVKLEYLDGATETISFPVENMLYFSSKTHKEEVIEEVIKK